MGKIKIINTIGDVLRGYQEFGQKTMDELAKLEEDRFGATVAISQDKKTYLLYRNNGQLPISGGWDWHDTININTFDVDSGETQWGVNDDDNITDWDGRYASDEMQKFIENESHTEYAEIYIHGGSDGYADFVEIGEIVA